jgi:ASCH domain
MIMSESPATSSWALVNGSPAVLSVRQPWAWALVSGHKDVENRTWSTKHRGFVAIHAAMRRDVDGFDALKQMGLTVPEALPRGAVVGVIELVDVVRHHSSPWASGDGFHWVVGRAVSTEPLPMRGRRGLFGAPPPVAEALIEAIGDP